MKIVDVSVFLVIIGILLLFFIVHSLEPEPISVVDINNNILGNNVRLTGSVLSYFSNKGHYFLEVGDKYNSVKVVFFKSIARKNPDLRDIRTNNTVSVDGEVALYEGDLEIIGEKIKLN